MMGSLAVWAAVAASAAAIAALLAADLQAQGYGIAASLALAGLGVAQPAYLAEAGALHATLLALATCAIGICAIALAKEQSARRIILLGGSLAGAQLVDLTDGMAAVLVLPALLRLPHARAELERTIGLYILLLFLPTLLLLGRLYFAWLGHGEIARWPGEPWRRDANRVVLVAIAAAILFLPILLQTLAVTQSTAISVILSLAAATLIAAMISAPAGSLSAVAAILPPLAILLTGQWPQSARRPRHAVLSVAAGSAVAWTYVLAAQALGHV